MTFLIVGGIFRLSPETRARGVANPVPAETWGHGNPRPSPVPLPLEPGSKKGLAVAGQPFVALLSPARYSPVPDRDLTNAMSELLINPFTVTSLRKLEPVTT